MNFQYDWLLYTARNKSLGEIVLTLFLKLPLGASCLSLHAAGTVVAKYGFIRHHMPISGRTVLSTGLAAYLLVLRI